MFTGIIKNVSKVATVRKTRGNLVVAVTQPAQWKVSAGESISVNGICSTVTSAKRGELFFEYMQETLRKTTAGSWRAGEKVNLEQSLRVGDALDGHMVMGHVDGVGVIHAIKTEGGSTVFSMKVRPAAAGRTFLKLLAPKGSLAVDGVSLTVVDACPPRRARRRRVGRNAFTVALVPYTLAHTNLQFRKVGDTVNIEADILAKYIARITHFRKHAYPPVGGLLCSSRRTAQGFLK